MINTLMPTYRELVEFACDALRHYEVEIRNAIETGVIIDDQFLQGDKVKQIVPHILDTLADIETNTPTLSVEQDKPKAIKMTPPRMF